MRRIKVRIRGHVRSKERGYFGDIGIIFFFWVSLVVVVAALFLMQDFFEWRKVDPVESTGSNTGNVSSLTGIARGGEIFAKSCFMCHGLEGVGGVRNTNYIKGTVPALDMLADRMFLYEKEDADKVISFLKKGQSLDKLSVDEKKEIPGYNRVVAQYVAIREIIREGAKPGKKDPDGPDPPLVMQSWKGEYSSREIDWVIGYLIGLMDWEEEEEDEDEDGRADPVEKDERYVKSEPSPVERGEVIPDAELVERTGDTFTLSGLRGKTVVLGFFYSNCNLESMCPAAASKLVRVQSALEAQGVRDVEFVLISFDPTRDTTESLDAFARKHGADRPRFRLATGRSDVVGPLAAKFQNYYSQASPGIFNHTIVISIVDRDGILRDDFFGTGWKLDDFTDAVAQVASLP